MRIDVDITATAGKFRLNCAFDVPAQGICAIFGKSGSGKTTLLRCIAGLNPCAGHIHIGHETWLDENLLIPPHQRPIGYVFQEPTLFPHLDVAANLKFGWKRTHQQVEIEDIVELLRLSPLLSRSVETLSGGEKQRVALGRAVLSSPRLLLLDEPLSALDSGTRDEALLFIERLRDNLKIPMLYVSHSHAEVSRLADHLVLIENGRVVMAGPMEELRIDPRCSLTHGPEAGLTISTTVTGHDEEFFLTHLSCGNGQLAVAKIDAVPGTIVRLAIKARDVTLSLAPPVDSSVLNSLPAAVTRIEDDGPTHVLVCLVSGTVPIVAHITRKSAVSLKLEKGLKVFVSVKSVALE